MFTAFSILYGYKKDQRDIKVFSEKVEEELQITNTNSDEEEDDDDENKTPKGSEE